MNTEKLEISSILRRYLIKYGDTEIKIEFPKPLQGKDIQTIEKDALLDTPLKELLSNGKIVNWSVNTENLKRRGYREKKKEQKNHKEKSHKEKKKDKEKQIRRMKVILEDGFTPKQRMTIMSNMEGVFSRLDYHKYIEERCKIKMNRFMSHGDIERALMDHIIEATGQKVVNPNSGHKVPTYRVIEKFPMDEYISKKLKDREKIIQQIQ